MRKWIARFCMAAMLLAAAPTVVPGVMPQAVTVAKAKTLTKKQARKKLVNYLKNQNLFNSQYQLVFDHKEGNDYVYHYYEDMGTHTATVNWYYVNKKSGKVTAMF